MGLWAAWAELGHKSTENFESLPSHSTCQKSRADLTSRDPRADPTTSRRLENRGPRFRGGTCMILIPNIAWVITGHFLLKMNCLIILHAVESWFILSLSLFNLLYVHACANLKEKHRSLPPIKFVLSCHLCNFIFSLLFHPSLILATNESYAKWDDAPFYSPLWNSLTSYEKRGGLAQW